MAVKGPLLMVDNELGSENTDNQEMVHPSCGAEMWGLGDPGQEAQI